MPQLSVVIPAFNEADRLPKTLTEILGILAPSGRAFEIMVVDDGSTDATAAEIRRFSEIDDRVRLLPLPRNQGKGHAVRSGVLACEGESVLVIDADGATPFAELGKLEAALAAGADIAIGTRASRASPQQVKALWYRKFLGAIFNGIVRLLTVKGFTDTQCGFKLFRRPAATWVFARQKLDGYCYDVETLLLAQKQNLRITEIAVDWAEQSGGKVNLLVDPPKMLVELLRIRWWLSTGAYDLRPWGAKGGAGAGDEGPTAAPAPPPVGGSRGWPGEHAKEPVSGSQA